MHRGRIAHCLHVLEPSNSDTQNRLLARSFNLAEMKALNENPQFHKAAGRMIFLRDFENVSELGQHLLDKGDAAICEALSFRPKSNRVPLNP